MTSIEGSTVIIDVPSLRVKLTIRLWLCITPTTWPERSILTATSHETQVTFACDRQSYQYQMSRRAGSDDASTETNAVVATANVRMTTSPYRRKVVIETSPWKIVGSNRDLVPSNRTSRSETRTCFSSSPLKVFFIAGLFRPTRVFFLA